MTSWTKNTKALKEERRTLRSNGTKAEGFLWKMLKGKKIEGLLFRRQFSVDHYILDFYCPSLKLAIELDGDFHFHGSIPEKDQQRDQFLKAKYGIKTLRFENKTLFEYPDIVINSIKFEKESQTTSANS